MVFPAGGATVIGSFKHVDYRGITITLTGDWHSGRLAALSPIMLRNYLLTEGKIRHISVL